MGTELQSEMHLPGYYSLRDLNDNTGNGSWSSHQQNNMFGQYHDFLLKRPAIDVNKGHDREQLRQTMLTHESVFKHQLHELHRLYRIQRDMMNEMRSKELHRHKMQGGTSQFSFYSSGIPVADDNGRHHTSNFLNHGRESMSAADTSNFEFRLMKENLLQSSYGPTQNRLRLNNCETLESGCKKLQRRLIDLELPADASNDEEEGLAFSGVSVVESCLHSRNHEVTRDRDGNLSIHTGVCSGYNGDVPNMRYPHGWRNLNEPIKHKEASASASTDVLGNITFSKEDMERRVLTSNSHSGFQCLSKFSQDPQKGREVGVNYNNLHLETERRQKGWLAYNIETGQSESNGISLSASFRPEDFPTTSKSQQTERRSSTEPMKKKLFGVEICERNHGVSVEDSHMLIRQSTVPQSNVENSESSLISSWKKQHSDISQDITMVQGNPSFSRFTPSNNSSVTMMQNPEVIKNKLVVNPRSIPIISGEASSQNHICHSSQWESKESWVSYSSNGYGHLNSISDGTYVPKKFVQDGSRNSCKDLGSMMDAKSSELKKAGAVPPYGYQNEATLQSAAVSANGSRKQSPQRGLPWLKVVPLCNGSSSEERQCSSQMNLDSLQNRLQQLNDKTETMRKSSFQSCVQDSLSATYALDAENQRTGVGECSSNRKILGCSIFEKPSMSKDHPSPSTISKPSVPAPLTSDTDSLKAGPHDTKAPYVMSPKFGVQHEVEGQMEKGLIKFSADSRRHIDLNMSVDDGVEEETQPTACCSSRTNQKISVEIDLEAPVVDETELDVAPGFESSQNKLPPGFESFQSKRPPDSEPIQINLPPGFESFQSKYTPGSVPPGFECFQSKYPPGSESVQTNLPPGFESFQSKYPPGSESVQRSLPSGIESFESKCPPTSESVQSNLPPGFESFQYKQPPSSESVQSKLPSGFKSFQCRHRKPVDTLPAESGEPREGLIMAAAEALVAISSSHTALQVDTFGHQSETSPGDPLHWFAEIISSHEGDIQNEIEWVSMGKDSVQEDILPDRMDYFEYMTLNLTESKVEEIGTFKPQVFEDSRNENILLKRPRRGQARRGRQRKDFKRDVLPSLSSLLINEVTEDLQTIEGLIQATGGTWKSSLALKNNRKGGGRRKRRLQDTDSPPNATETCPPQTHLPNCREVAIEDHASLFGWGKRTRRPPRQRYPINNPPLTIK